MRWALAVTMASAVACSSKREPTPTAVPAGLPKLKVSIDSKIVPMTTAFIAHRSDGTFRLLVSNAAGSCADLVAGRLAGAQGFIATVAAQLDPHGQPRYTTISIGKLGSDKELEPKQLKEAFVGTVAAEQGKTTPVQLEILEDDVGIGVAGQLDAMGCGEQELPAQAGSPGAASTGVMWIATKKFPIRGAILHGDTMQLFDQPKDCSAAMPSVGARLTRTQGKWTLDGNRIPVVAIADAPKLVVAPGATDGATVQLALSGSDRIGDYMIVLEGSVTALDCK